MQMKETAIRKLVLFGEIYYRSDLAAEMLKIHKNTLLQKAREGKIRRYRHDHAVWFSEKWLKDFVNGD